MLHSSRAISYSLCGILVSFTTVFGQTAEFINPAGGHTGVPENWSTNQVPFSSFDVNLPGPLEITFDKDYGFIGLGKDVREITFDLNGNSLNPSLSSQSLVPPPTPLKLVVKNGLLDSSLILMAGRDMDLHLVDVLDGFRPDTRVFGSSSNMMDLHITDSALTNVSVDFRPLDNDLARMKLAIDNSKVSFSSFNNPSRSEIDIDNASEVEFKRIDVGAGSMSIRNGSKVQGDINFTGDEMILDGAGTELRSDNGRLDLVNLALSNGASINGNNLNIINQSSGPAQLLRVGPGSVLECATISWFSSSDAAIELNDGVVEATHGGIMTFNLNGHGVIDVGDSSTALALFVDPTYGLLDIQGELRVLQRVKLDIEDIDSLKYDTLFVSGDLDAQRDDIELHFLPNFRASVGDQVDLIEAGGQMFGFAIGVDIGDLGSRFGGPHLATVFGLPSGYQITDYYVDGKYGFRVTAVPEASSLLTATFVCVIIAVARVRWAIKRS